MARGEPKAIVPKTTKPQRIRFKISVFIFSARSNQR